MIRQEFAAIVLVLLLAGPITAQQSQAKPTETLKTMLKAQVRSAPARAVKHQQKQGVLVANALAQHNCRSSRPTLDGVLDWGSHSLLGGASKKSKVKCCLPAAFCVIKEAAVTACTTGHQQGETLNDQVIVSFLLQ
jgi:Tfp pilus assembly protein FimT